MIHDRPAPARPLDFARVAEGARARLPALLRRWLPDGKRQGKDWVARNPTRNDRRAGSFRICLTTGRWIDFATADAGGDAIALLAYLDRSNQATAARKLAEDLGIDPYTDERARPRPKPPAPDGEARRRARALVIFDEAKELAGSPAEHYLRDVRGIPPKPPWPEDLRFHPACPRGKGRAPALVALMRDVKTNEPRAIHRTFLLPDGSAKDESEGDAKMTLAPTTGTVIKLTEDAEVTMGLALAEGIETAMSCRALGWPVWAAASAGAIAQFPVLEAIDALTIFADHDSAGMAAALSCAERWRAAGREVQIIRPRTEGQDWNDALRL